jgi:hypothetical protein
MVVNKAYSSNRHWLIAEVLLSGHECDGPPEEAFTSQWFTSQVGVWLRKVVSGYYQYHAVPGNIDQLRIFRRRVNQLWHSVLVRRSQTARKKWEKFTPVFERWIPSPCVLHPYPEARFYATHPS